MTQNSLRWQEHLVRFGILYKDSHCGTIWVANQAYGDELALFGGGGDDRSAK